MHVGKGDAVMVADSDFAPDECDRVASTDPLLAAESFTYDGNGNLRFMTDRKNQVTEFRYDLEDRLDEKVLLPGLPEESVRTYGYDVMNNLTAVSDPVSALAYSYDLLNRLETASTAGAPHQPAITLITGYDGNDRRISLDDDLVGITAYGYDALNRRIQKNVDGSVTTYVYDQEDIHFEFDGSGPSATIAARYTHGARIDEPLVMQRDLDGGGGFGPGEAFFYHSEGLGSVIALSDDLGTVVAETAYDGFGSVVLQTGSVINPYSYTGRERDPESGLMYYRARYYAPAMGRFIGEDPLGFGAGDTNLQRYALNNVLYWTDPSGLDSLQFDGSNLTLLDDSGGVIEQWPASSGAPGTTPADQNEPWSGPIPEGEYSADPDLIDRFNWFDPRDHDWYGPQARIDWGNCRVPLARTSHPSGVGTGFRGPTGKEICAARCPASGKRSFAGCRAPEARPKGRHETAAQRRKRLDRSVGYALRRFHRWFDSFHGDDDPSRVRSPG